jgi:hypothetical protein
MMLLATEQRAEKASVGLQVVWAWVVLSMLVMGCSSPRPWTVLRQATPNPLVNQRTVAAAPIEFGDAEVGGELREAMRAAHFAALRKEAWQRWIDVVSEEQAAPFVVRTTIHCLGLNPLGGDVRPHVRTGSGRLVARFDQEGGGLVGVMVMWHAGASGGGYCARATVDIRDAGGALVDQIELEPCMFAVKDGLLAAADGIPEQERVTGISDSLAYATVEYLARRAGGRQQKREGEPPPLPLPTTVSAPAASGSPAPTAVSPAAGKLEVGGGQLSRGPPPEGAARVRFGMTRTETEQVCREAGMQVLGGSPAVVCLGRPPTLDLQGRLEAGLCNDLVCNIEVVGAANTPQQLVAQFNTLRNALTSRYGPPADYATKGMQECAATLFECAVDGRFTAYRVWRWEAGHQIRLAVEVRDQKPALVLSYRAPQRTEAEPVEPDL